MTTSATSRLSLNHLREFARKGLVRNFIALFTAEAVTKTALLVSFAVISRLVGPAAVGYLALAQTLTGYAALFGDGGISTFGQRQVAAEPARVNQVASTATVAQIALASITMVISGAFALFGPIASDVTRLLVVMLPVLIAQALSLIYVLQGLERMRDVATVRGVATIVTAGLGLGMVLLTRDVIWAAVGMPVGVLVGDAVCVWFLFRRYQFRPTGVRLGQVIEVVRNGAPFLGIALLSQLLISLDIIALSLFGTAAAVGIYSVAYRLVLIAFTVSGLLTQAAFPQLVKRFQTSVTRFQDLLRLLVRLAAHFAFPATAMLVVEAPSIVRALFGPEYADSSDVLRLLAFWVPLGFYNSVVANALVAAGHQRTYFGVVGVGVLVTAVGMAVLVPISGTVGAAQVVLLREGTMLVLFSISSSRALSMGTVSVLARQAMWFIVPFGALFGLNLVLPFFSLFLSLAVLIVSVLAIEWASGWPLLRELMGLGSED